MSKESGRSGAPRLRHEAQRQQPGGDADGHVDEEDPLPREQLGQHAAQQQAERGAARGDRAPDAERLRAVGALLEGGRDDRQRGGGDQRGAEALQRRGRRSASPWSARARTAARRPRTRATPARKIRLRPTQVARAAAEQQEAAEQQRVAVDDPLQVGRRRSRGPRWIDGSATLVIVASRMTMNCARQTRTRTSQRLVSARRRLGDRAAIGDGASWGLLLGWCGLGRERERGLRLRRRRQRERRRGDVQVLAEQPADQARARRESCQPVERAAVEVAHTRAG